MSIDEMIAMENFSEPFPGDDIYDSMKIETTCVVEINSTTDGDNIIKVSTFTLADGVAVEKTSATIVDQENMEMVAEALEVITYACIKSLIEQQNEEAQLGR